MALINLKFSPEMEELVLQGKKCCTTRDEKKGEVGDLFVVKNRLYRIVQIDCIQFVDVLTMYNSEGFTSEIEFEDEMMNYYTGITYDDEIYIHFFAYVGDWCPQFGVSGAACSNPEEFCELYSDCLKERKL